MKWRSVLFTPGTRPDRIEKAWRQGAADVVVADLEDAVPPAGKDQARRDVAAALAKTEDAACLRGVRINAWPGAQAEADLAAVLPHAPTLLVVPKAEDPAAVQALATRLAHPTRMMLIIETARGVLRADDLAACPAVDAIAFGAEDLAADAGMVRSPNNDEVAVPRALVALGAAANGTAAIDMITADIGDLDRFRREVREAVGLGYAGKMCLHPAQVDAVHEEMAPTPDQLAWAQAVVAAVDEAGAGAGGVVVVDGKMVDVPVIRQARSILARAGQTG